MGHFTEWPTEFHYFRRLSNLHVDGYQQKRLPLDAFSGGLEATLTILQLSLSKLDGIPYAICQLQSLRTLYYLSNFNTTSPLFGPCDHEITSVRNLWLWNNNVREFPDVLRSFTNLTTLDLRENSIQTIPAKLIPPGQPLTSMNLRYNQLHRIPVALSLLSNLQTLYLEHNNIVSLEDYDLLSLTSLKNLYMSYNPLQYVSDNVFQSQPSLYTLGLRHTDLDDIPHAITRLSSVGTLDLRDVAIDCSCSMVEIQESGVTIYNLVGECSKTGENLMYYMDTFLKLCP